MAYNLTNLSQNTTGILSLAQNVNETLTLGWLGSLFLIGLTVVMLLSFIFATNDVKRSIAATSFLSFGLALMLKAVSLVPTLAVYIALVVCAASLAFTWKR